MGAGSRCRSPFVAVSRPVDRRTRASSITGVTERRSSALTVRSRGRRSQDACSPGGPGSGSTGCGLRLLFDRERGADLPIDSPVLATGPPLGGRTPPERERGLVLTLGRGHFSPQPQTSQPFTPVRVINALEGTAERDSTVLTARRRVWTWWARKCLTRKGSEVTVRSTSPLRAVHAGLLGDKRDRGGAAYAGPRPR
jgi:hypothetical protein